MPTAPGLQAALQTLDDTTSRVRLYRAAQLRHLPTLTSAQGAWQGENRYTRTELSHALYLGEAPDLAMIEATRQYQALFITLLLPAFVIVPAEVRLRGAGLDGPGGLSRPAEVVQRLHRRLA